MSNSFWHDSDPPDWAEISKHDAMFADPAEGEQRIDWYKVLAVVVAFALSFGFWAPILMTARNWFMSR